jgi:peptidyl-prolyl cis-trans isomerase C
MTHTPLRLAALMLGTILLGTPAFAAENDTVAKVNSQTISVDAYRVQQSRLPAQYFEGNEAAKTRKMLFDELVNDALLLDAADKAAIAKTPEYAARLAEFKDYLSRELYLTQFLKQVVTEDKLKAAYTAQYEKGPRSKDVRARHILLKTKADADAVIAQLNKGASFADLAKEKSNDISKIQGGDLGWFSYETMVEPFAEAAFKLKAGEYTRQPVETPFGWHVILVEETRAKKAAPFDEAKPQLEQDLNQKAIEAHLAALRKQAKITVNKDVLGKLEQEKPVASPEDDGGDADFHQH